MSELPVGIKSGFLTEFGGIAQMLPFIEVFFFRNSVSELKFIVGAKIQTRRGAFVTMKSQNLDINVNVLLGL